MTKLGTLHNYGKELEKRLRLWTYPLAIKLLEKEEDIPEGAVRPLRDLGYRLMACQAFAMSRWEGATIATLKEDMWCFEPVVAYGIEKPPQYFLDGYSRYPQQNKTLEAGSNAAHEFPCLEYGKYIGIVSAPLTTTNFEPDLVIIYCDSEQLDLLLYARQYLDGHNLKCTLSHAAGCVFAVVPVMQNGDCNVAVPCPGDRYRGHAQNFEIVFTVSKEKLGELLSGLIYLDEGDRGLTLPGSHDMNLEPVMTEAYEKIGEMLGIRSNKQTK